MKSHFLTNPQLELFEKVCRQRNDEQFEAALESVKRAGEYPSDWLEKIRLSTMADFYYRPKELWDVTGAAAKRKGFALDWMKVQPNGFTAYFRRDDDTGQIDHDAKV
jgi:hypothetical protein